MFNLKLMLPQKYAMTRCIAVGILVLATLGTMLAEEKSSSQLKVSELAKPEDKTSIEVSEKTTLLRFHSPALRGYCKVTAAKGKWPEQVTLFFEGLRDLEHFELTSGRMYLQGSRNSSGAFSLYVLGADLDFGKRSRLGTIDIRVDRQKEGVLVTFPAKFFGEADQVTLSWLDFLRR